MDQWRLVSEDHWIISISIIPQGARVLTGDKHHLISQRQQTWSSATTVQAKWHFSVRLDEGSPRVFSSRLIMQPTVLHVGGFGSYWKGIKSLFSDLSFGWLDLTNRLTSISDCLVWQDKKEKHTILVTEYDLGVKAKSRQKGLKNTCTGEWWCWTRGERHHRSEW